MKNKKIALILTSAALVAAGGLFAYNRLGSKVADDKGSTPSSEAVNLDPPTETEVKEADQNKQRLIKEEVAQLSEASNDTNKLKANPLFGFLQQSGNGSVEANGYITEVVENDGTCTLTLNKNGQKVSKSKQAMPDAQSTICGLMVIERNQLSPGDWRATITYSSSKYHGISEERSIRIN